MLKFYHTALVITAKKVPEIMQIAMISGTLLVDDNGFEPLTLRTSSECSTS